MSKIVKGAVRAVKKVVKGVAKVAKKIVKSPIGKIAVLAAATYFGVPMISGAISGAGSGAGILAGAMNGLSSAWAGVTGAVSAGSLSGAASSLSAGFSGTAGAAGAAGAAGGLVTPAVTAGGAAMANPVVAGAAAPAATGWFGGLSGAGQAAAINAGTQLVGGLMQGYGAQQNQKHQEQMDAQARSRYNANVGANLWGRAPTAMGGTYGVGAPAAINQQGVIDQMMARARQLRGQA